MGGLPLYYATDNAIAARSVNTAATHPGGVSGLNLTGAGVMLGIWDGGGVRAAHQEFAGRAVQRDAASSVNFHATHVAATMIAVGVNPSAKGMSPEARIDCREWTADEAEMNAAAGAGLRVSNHSYGFLTGWQEVAGVIILPAPPPTIQEGGLSANWFWWGDTGVSEFEDYLFGFYSFQSRAWDEIAFEHPRYLWVKSAGNDRNDGPPPGTPHVYFHPQTGDPVLSTATRSKDGNGGYDSISHAGVSKNGLTVGAVNDLSGGYSGPFSVSMSSFSCWGPTDDGRIKPDIVGNGVGLFSALEDTNQHYGVLSGTSMSSPNVSGSLGILIEQFRRTHPGQPDMLASTLKGLVIHTADECGGAIGPDYVYGWGLLNTRRAAELIGLDETIPLIITEHTLFSGETIELIAFSDPAAPDTRATICWTDPLSTVVIPQTVDPDTPVLVNDLDLRIVGEHETFMPWTLDRSVPPAAAVPGDNVVDNVEQVVLETGSSEALRVRVSAKGDLGGGQQAFSLIISGVTNVTMEAESNPPLIASATPSSGSTVGGVPSINVTFNEPVFGVQSALLSINGAAPTTVEGSGAGPYRFTGFPVLPDGSNTATMSGGDIKDIFDNAFAGSTWSFTKRDCNNNLVLDASDIAGGVSEDCNVNGLPDECDPDALRLTLDAEMTVALGDLIGIGTDAPVTGGAPPYEFSWTLRGNADGESSTDANPLFRPTEPGIYVARVVVRDSIGCEILGFITVRVTEADLAGPLPDAIGTGGSMCPFGASAASAGVVGFVLAGFGLRRRRRRRRAPRR
jgi:hypothetical protein